MINQPDWEELARRRAEESVNPAREATEQGPGGDHDRATRLLSPFPLGVVDAWIRLLARVTREELGGPEDGR